MFRTALLGALALSLIVFTSACGGSASSDNPDGGSRYLVAKPEAIPQGERSTSLDPVYTDPTPDDALTFDVIAGQTIDAGDVSITNTGDSIDVCFELAAGWTATEAHAYASTNLPDSKGNPGHFEFQTTFDPGSGADCFSIPVDNVAAKTLYYVAVHFVVVNGLQSETAWIGTWTDSGGDWDHDWSKRWGGYVDYCPMPMPELPSGVQSYKGYHYGTYSYWNVRFDDQNLDLSMPPGVFTVSGNDYYVGWCVDKNHTMYGGHSYGVKLYSTYDEDLDALLTDDMPIMTNGNWDFINYMINQRRNPTTGGLYDVAWTNTNMDHFQNAVWYFSNGIVPSGSSLAEDFVEDALLNGDNYRPKSGQWYGIALYPENIGGHNLQRAQFNVIEVDP